MDKEFIEFLKDAYSGGLCNEYRDEIRKCHEDKLSLVRLAMRQQSIPYIATKMHDGVITKAYLQKVFGDFLNGFVLKDCDGVNGYKYSWYVDYDCNKDLVVESDVLHISHTVGASVIVPTSKCPNIYISNRSKVHLVGEGFNTINVKLFDKSELIVEDVDENSKIVVYKYSDMAKVVKGKYCLGKVNVFDKELKI